MKEKVRQSNFELMRIISMIFIVLYHILIHGQIIEHATGAMEVFLVFIESILLVHVNSFILLSGYFQCESKLKAGKVIQLNNMVWFYKVVIMVALIGTGILAKPDLMTRLHTYFPIDYGTYWFIGSYLILYLISPILNKIINHSNQKELRRIIIVLFLIISIASTFSLDIFFNTETGRSLSTFILLYFIGAYCRKYPIDNSYFMKPFTKKAKTCIYFLIFITFALISTFCWIGYNHLIPLGNIASELGSIIGVAHISYASPIVIIETVGYFLLFGTLTFKNKWINKIAGCTLAVYLISENIYIRQMLYDYLGITKVTAITFPFILQMILLTLIIFVICIIIEMIRKWIFKIIYNTKLAEKNRNWYRNYIKELGININW